MLIIPAQKLNGNVITFKTDGETNADNELDSSQVRKPSEPIVDDAGQISIRFDQNYSAS